jgi:hypothetical protein
MFVEVDSSIDSADHARQTHSIAITSIFGLS